MIIQPKQLIQQFRVWIPKYKKLIQPCFIEFEKDGTWTAYKYEERPTSIQSDDKPVVTRKTPFADWWEGDILNVKGDKDKSMCVIVWTNGSFKKQFYTNGKPHLDGIDKAVSYTHLTLPTICSV